MASAVRIRLGGPISQRVGVICLVLTVVSVGLVGLPERSRAGGGCRFAHGVYDQISNQEAEHALVCLLNKERHEAGSPRLDQNKQLTAAAGKHSRTMKRVRCFAHTCRGEPGLESRLRHAGYLPCNCFYGIGEALAYGVGANSAPAVIMRSWMRSPKHRVILLGGGYDDVGFGVVRGIPSDADAEGRIFTADVGYRR